MISQIRLRVRNISLLLIIVFVLIAAFSSLLGGAASAQGPDEINSAAAATAGSENINFVGHLGGMSTAVAVDGSYAYVGEGPRLTIFDVSDKADPVVVGQTAPLPGIILGVKHAGIYAYAAAGWAGLRIIDVSNPAAPVEVGSFDTPSYVRDIAIDGSYAYVPDGGYGLRVVDISNPAAPVQVGISSEQIWMMDVAVAGGYAYVATEDFGLDIYDVSDPTAPAFLGFFGTSAEALEVAVSGATAYITDSTGNLYAVDVSDPKVPTLRTKIDLDISGNGLTVEAGTLYIGDDNTLRIFDVTDPDILSQEGTFEVETGIGGLVVNGSNGYLLAAGLHIIDISDKSAPAESALYHMLGTVVDVALSGDYAYLAAAWDGLAIVDISDPSAPTLAGQLATSTPANGVTVNGSTAYVASSWSGLRVIDASNPMAPVETAQLSTPGSAHDVAVSGGIAYVASSWSGLRAVDVSSPSTPFERGFVDTPGSARAVALAEQYAFVADDLAGLRVIDIRYPSALEEVGSLDTPGNAQDVVIAGDIAYVADESSGIHLIDVSDPETPELVASFDTLGAAYGIAVAGKHVYIGDGGNLRVVDVCDQTAPTATGFYKTAGAARRIALQDSMAFLADDYGGLLILEYTGPGSITIEKQADFEDITSFNFGSDLGSFALKAGASKVFPEVSSGDYEIVENLPLGWYLHSVTCDSVNVAEIMDGVAIQLQNAEDVSCTFNNRRLSVTADSGGPYAGEEGTAIALDASTSSNLEMITTYKWDCTNDGSWDFTTSSPVGSSCTYADDGLFTIKLRTWDVFGETATATTTAAVSNVAPQVDAGDDLTAVAGAIVHLAGSFSDPGLDDTHTIGWDFGDGSQQSGSLTPNHTFTESGQYTVVLTVTDDDGDTGSDTLIADITSEGPAISDFNVSPAEVSEGESVVLAGNITQDPPESPLTLAISWGDGQTITESLAAGSSSFSVQHIYVDDEPSGTPSDDYMISLELSDGQGTLNAKAVVKVNNAPPSIDAGPDRLVPAGIEVPFTAAVSDPGLDDTHILTWDFGDGTAAQTAKDLNHTFADPGEYTVTVTAEDDDGGSGSDTIEITVRSMIRLPIMIRS